MVGTIAILLDDVLNNFSETLNNEGILYDRKKNSVEDPLLKKCLYNLKTGKLTEIAQKSMRCKCIWKSASPFCHSLLLDGWKIILCTNRDLRFAYQITVDWLSKYDIPYNYLVQTQDPVDFCRKMKIPYLISDRPLPRKNGITIFDCSVEMVQSYLKNGFDYYKEVMKCFQK